MSFKGKNPKEILREKTKNLPKQYPDGVYYNKTSQGILAWLSFNGLHYEACSDSSKHVVQKLAVYILYGEYGQDAVELYNYYLRKDAKDTGMNQQVDTSLYLDSDSVRSEVEKLKQPGETNKTEVKPAKKEKKSSAAVGSLKPKNVMQQNTLLTNIEAPPIGPTADIERNKKRKAEKAKLTEENLEDQPSEEKQSMDCGEVLPSELQAAPGHDIILELERKLSKQMLITFEPVKLPPEDEIESKIKSLEEFINNSNYDIEIESCAFECVPSGCSPFYCLIGLEYLDKRKQRSDHIFVGKGWDKENAKCYALQVTVEFIKRSRALDHKLIPPNDDIMATVAHVLQYDGSEIPFKSKFNKQFALYQVSLAHEDKTYISGYYADENDAREDAAKKLLKSLDYCFCGDSKNRNLTIDENMG